MWLIYQITNRITGKRYIGVTGRSLRTRWHGHLNHAADHGRTGALQRSIRKYGPQTFLIELVTEAIDEREAGAIERALIAERRTMVPFGYNMTTGGEDTVGFRHSAETKQKLREKLLAKPEQLARIAAMAANRKGAKQTPEARARMSAAKIGNRNAAGRVISEETRAKFRAAVERRKTNGTWFKPRQVGEYPHSDETRARLSTSHLARAQTEDGRAAIRAVASKRQKINDSQVSEIRKLAAAGERTSVLARKFGVSPQLISLIKSGTRRQLSN